VRNGFGSGLAFDLAFGSGVWMHVCVCCLGGWLSFYATVGYEQAWGVAHQGRSGPLSGRVALVGAEISLGGNG
jgi:hypothetical protein